MDTMAILTQAASCDFLQTASVYGFTDYKFSMLGFSME